MALAMAHSRSLWGGEPSFGSPQAAGIDRWEFLERLRGQDTYCAILFLLPPPKSPCPTRAKEASQPGRRRFDPGRPLSLEPRRRQRVPLSLKVAHRRSQPEGSGWVPGRQLELRDQLVEVYGVHACIAVVLLGRLEARPLDSRRRGGGRAAALAPGGGAVTVRRAGRPSVGASAREQRMTALLPRAPSSCLLTCMHMHV